MKKSILGLFLACSAFASQAQVQLTNGCVNLAWDNHNPPGFTDAVCLYHHTNAAAPFTNWVKIATAPGDTTNSQVNIPPGSHFFSITFSNVWGETIPSNVIGTPPVLSPASGLRITSISLTFAP